MSNLDLSLEDLIKMNKKTKGSENSRSKPRNSGPGPSRRVPNRANNRSTPYGAQKVVNLCLIMVCLLDFYVFYG